MHQDIQRTTTTTTTTTTFTPRKQEKGSIWLYQIARNRNFCIKRLLVLAVRKFRGPLAGTEAKKRTNGSLPGEIRTKTTKTSPRKRCHGPEQPTNEKYLSYVSNKTTKQTTSR
jgi:hypothetical protein